MDKFRPTRPPKPRDEHPQEIILSQLAQPFRIKLEGGGGSTDNTAVLAAIAALSAKADALAAKIDALIATPEQVAQIQASTEKLGENIGDVNKSIDDAKEGV